jgi:hypothetical protein
MNVQARKRALQPVISKFCFFSGIILAILDPNPDLKHWEKISIFFCSAGKLQTGSRIQEAKSSLIAGRSCYDPLHKTAGRTVEVITFL